MDNGWKIRLHERGSQKNINPGDISGTVMVESPDFRSDNVNMPIGSQCGR